MTMKPPTAKRQAKSLTYLRRRVRELEKVWRETCDLLEQYSKDRKALALLASDKPEFDNPLVCREAKKRRDEILKEMGR